MAGSQHTTARLEQQICAELRLVVFVIVGVFIYYNYLRIPILTIISIVSIVIVIIIMIIISIVIFS